MNSVTSHGYSPPAFAWQKTFKKPLPGIAILPLINYGDVPWQSPVSRGFLFGGPNVGPQDLAVWE